MHLPYFINLMLKAYIFLQKKTPPEAGFFSIATTYYLKYIRINIYNLHKIFSLHIGNKKGSRSYNWVGPLMLIIDRCYFKSLAWHCFSKLLKTMFWCVIPKAYW